MILSSPWSKPNIALLQAKINLNLLDKTLLNNKVIIYIDNYFLQKLVHAPHFVIVDSLTDEGYLLLDPWDGKEKIVSRDFIRENDIEFKK